jgi:hypothetical protein
MIALPKGIVLFRFVFALVWTAITAVLVAGTYRTVEGVERYALLFMPVFGAGFAYLSWLYLRRERSLHTESEHGVTVYVWIDLNGREARSTADPRPDWDEADGDGDGGGD